MTSIEESKRMSEDFVKFFAMEPLEQSRYVGGLPHDHGHPQYSQSASVGLIKEIVDNFFDYNVQIERVSVSVLEGTLEADMEYVLETGIDGSESDRLWSEHALLRHPMWRLLRRLARELLQHAGIPRTDPSVGADVLSCR